MKSHASLSRYARTAGLAIAVVGTLVAGASCVSTPFDTAVAATGPAIVTASTPKPVSLPRTAMAAGLLEGWKLATPETLAEVGPAVGSAQDGSIVLGVDAPSVSASATVAASTEVGVEPNTTYLFSAYARVLHPTPTSTGAAFKLGNTAVSLPKLNAEWQKITGSYQTGDSETTLLLSLTVGKAVRGLQVDTLVVAPAANGVAGANVLPNGSFEKVTPNIKRGIVSTSLVLTTKTAAVAVAMPAGTISWRVLKGSKAVAKGSVSKKGAITALPLTKVKQGYYTLKVTASDKKSVTTNIAVIDSPRPWLYQDKRFGVQTKFETGLYIDAARQARALGFGTVRNSVHWATNEKVKGKYDFSRYQGVFDRVSANGLKVLAIVNSGNPLYGNPQYPKSKTAVRAYGKYAAAIAKRFDLEGLEVFNEFNHKPFNAGCRTGACYAPLLKSVSTYANKVKPKLPIIAGATAQYDDAFFTSLWRKSGAKYADAMSYHPYWITDKPERLTSVAKQARATMSRYAKKTLPMWITEIGTSAQSPRPVLRQPSLLMRSEVLALANKVKKIYWYELINTGSKKSDHHSNFGLYEYPKKGVVALAPKLSGFVQALTIAQLGGRTFRASTKAGSGVVSYSFGSTSDTVRVIWSPKGTKTATIKTTKPVVLVKYDGTTKTLKPSKGVVKFSVTSTPSFLRSGKAAAGITK